MASSKPRAPRLGRGLSSLMAQPVQVAPPSSSSALAPTSDVASPSAGAMPSSVGPAKLPATATAAPPQPPAAVAAAAEDSAAAGNGLHFLQLDAIRTNPHQPRQRFDEAAIEGLAASIRAEGLMQPIIVRPIAEDRQGDGDGSVRYELVAGERRLRAARLVGLDTIPSLVRDLDDRQLAEWALIENLQREDLNPIERAEAFANLASKFDLSHDEIAQRVGADRSTVTNLLRLLSLESSVRDWVRDGVLSMGQARALAGLSDSALQKAMAQQAVAHGWSVRQVEQAVRRAVDQASGNGNGQGRSAAAGRPVNRPAHLADLEAHIGRQIGSKVRIRPGRRKGTGAITIEFYNLDQFDALLSKLGVEAE